MIYNVGGLVLAMCVAAIAWRRSRGTGASYDRDVYGMGAMTHRRYAIASLAFAAFFAATYIARAPAAGIVGLALYALVAVLYAASFLQGAPDRDE